MLVLGLWEGILAIAGLVGGLWTVNRFIGIYSTSKQAQARPFNEARDALENALDKKKREVASLKTRLYHANNGPGEELAQLEYSGEDDQAGEDMEMMRPLYEEFVPPWVQKLVDFETAKDIVVKRPELIRNMIGWAKNKYASGKQTNTETGDNSKAAMVEAV